MAEIEALVGLKVGEIEFSSECIKLHGMQNGEGKTYRLDPEGDCCSTSWFESIIEQNSLVGHTIISVENLDLDNPANGKTCEKCGADHNEKKPHDELKFYGFALNTNLGRCIIDYRNDSNGYYGGEVRVFDATPKHAGDSLGELNG